MEQSRCHRKSFNFNSFPLMEASPVQSGWHGSYHLGTCAHCREPRGPKASEAILPLKTSAQVGRERKGEKPRYESPVHGSIEVASSLEKARPRSWARLGLHIRLLRYNVYTVMRALPRERKIRTWGIICIYFAYGKRDRATEDRTDGQRAPAPHPPHNPTHVLPRWRDT